MGTADPGTGGAGCGKVCAVNPDDRLEMVERNQMRRQMAKASMLLTWVIVIAFLWGLADDKVAARVALVWPPFSILFPALIGYIAHYSWLGSRENQTLLEKDNP